MRINRTTVLAVAGAATLVPFALLAAGCGDDHEEATARGNATDAAFVNDMTEHHQGAIDMAVMARRQAEHPEIRALSGEIIAAQEGEIREMKRMHEDMRDMHNDATHGGHMGMSDDAMGMGMDMDELERARPFDKAFLRTMVEHHQGAIAMAEELLEKGEHPELRRMAQEIIDAQTREIEQMRAWMKEWYGA